MSDCFLASCVSYAPKRFPLKVNLGHGVPLRKLFQYVFCVIIYRLFWLVLCRRLFCALCFCGSFTLLFYLSRLSYCCNFHRDRSSFDAGLVGACHIESVFCQAVLSHWIGLIELSHVVTVSCHVDWSYWVVTCGIHVHPCRLLYSGRIARLVHSASLVSSGCYALYLAVWLMSYIVMYWPWLLVWDHLHPCRSLVV